MSEKKQRRSAPQAYIDGKLDKHNFKNKTPEERHEIAMKGVEARRKKKQDKMLLQNLAKRLMYMPPDSIKQKEILKKFGFESDEVSNGALMIVALYKKALSGDVSAFREFAQMLDALDLMESGEQALNQTVTINLISTGHAYEPTEEQEEDIWKAENGILETKPEDDLWETDADDEWGDEVYDG